MSGGVEIAIVSHFRRGENFGGSQRTTAMVERLEAFGASVKWITVPESAVTPGNKVRALVRMRPSVLEFHRAPASIPGEFDAVIAVHSYMSPYLDQVRAVRRFVDFQNLEWVYMSEIASLSPPLKRLYRGWQAVLTRRYERAVLRSGDTAFMTTEPELEWAQRQRPLGRTILVPNALPAEQIAWARAIRSARAAASPRSSFVVYLGTLSYPPNWLSLQRFLQSEWLEIVRKAPGVRLRVVGRITPSQRALLERHDRLEVAGYVEDLNHVLIEAKAAVLPVDAGGGSSMRMLFLGLAGVPVVASKRAARTLESMAYAIADSGSVWASLLAELWSRDRPAMDGPISAAEEWHADPEPWRAFVEAVCGAGSGFASSAGVP